MGRQRPSWASSGAPAGQSPTQRQHWHPSLRGIHLSFPLACLLKTAASSCAARREEPRTCHQGPSGGAWWPAGVLRGSKHVGCGSWIGSGCIAVAFGGGASWAKRKREISLRMRPPASIRSRSTGTAERCQARFLLAQDDPPQKHQRLHPSPIQSSSLGHWVQAGRAIMRFRSDQILEDLLCS